MSLTPERRTHFRQLAASPRHSHGTNLNPVPVPTGTLRELLDDGDAVDRVRALADELDADGGMPGLTRLIRAALRGDQ